MKALAVAVFKTRRVKGEVIASRHPTRKNAVSLRVHFTQLPPGDHGFHIHKAGDLRGKGCKGACDHYHVGSPQSHGGSPMEGNGPKGTKGTKGTRGARGARGTANRHTGDLGNIRGPSYKRTYTIPSVHIDDLWGRSLIVHADPDDLGHGSHADSSTTGHSGKRIACAIFGRGCLR